MKNMKQFPNGTATNKHYYKKGKMGDLTNQWQISHTLTEFAITVSEKTIISISWSLALRLHLLCKCAVWQFYWVINNSLSDWLTKSDPKIHSFWPFWFIFSAIGFKDSDQKVFPFLWRYLWFSKNLNYWRFNPIIDLIIIT